MGVRGGGVGVEGACSAFDTQRADVIGFDDYVYHSLRS